MAPTSSLSVRTRSVVWCAVTKPNCAQRAHSAMQSALLRQRRGLGNFYSDVHGVQFVSARENGAAVAPPRAQTTSRCCTICQDTTGDIGIYCQCATGYHDECIVEQLRRMGGRVQCTVCKCNLSVVYTPAPAPAAGYAGDDSPTDADYHDSARGGTLARQCAALAVGLVLCALAQRTAAGTLVTALCAIVLPCAAATLTWAHMLPPSLPTRPVLPLFALALNVCVPRLAEQVTGVRYAHPCEPYVAMSSAREFSLYALALRYGGESNERVCAAALLAWRCVYALALASLATPFQCWMLSCGGGGRGASRSLRAKPARLVCTIALFDRSRS